MALDSCSTQARVSPKLGPRATGIQICRPRRPVSLGCPRTPEMVQGGAVQPGQHQHVVPGRGLAGVDVDQRVIRLVRLVGARGPGVPFQRAEVGRPDQRGRLVHHQVGAGLAGLGSRVGPARQPARRVVGQLLVPEPGGVRAAREAVHVQRPARQVGQRDRGDLRGIADQLPLGHRRRAVARREQRLVQVGQLELPAEHGPAAAVAERVQAGQLVRGRPGAAAAGGAAPRPAAAGRSDRHIRSGSAFTSSLVRPLSTEAG